MQSKRSTTAGRSSRFSEIRRPVTPERRARIDAIKRAMVDAESLAQLRVAHGVTQVDLAERLGVRQASVSELERRDDVYLSSLRSYVEALGGRLEVAAVFDGERHPIALGAARSG